MLHQLLIKKNMQFVIEMEIAEIPKVLRKRREISLKKFSSKLVEPILITGVASSIDLPGWGIQKMADEMGINVKARYTSEVGKFKANTIIALSFSGETEETIGILKKSDAKVKIAITSDPNSTIAEYATDVIPMICGPQISDSATKSVVEEYYIVNQLISEKFGKYTPITDGEIKQIEKNLALTFSADIIDKFLRTKRVVIVGSRGLGEEVETKFQEVTRTQAESIPGPVIFYSSIEVLTQGEIILVIEPELMKDYNAVLKKSARVSDIFYIDKLGIKVKDHKYYKELIRYAGLLKFVVDIGKAKRVDIDHPEIFMRTVRGLKPLHLLGIRKVVVMGGGSGIPSLIKAFKKVSQNVTAITSMVDSGGSAGKLRKDYNVMPPGDIRRLVAALSDHPKAKEIVNYRFREGSLDGHTFGNILFAALEKLSGFKDAKEEIEKMLGAKGKSLPGTLDNITIHAELENGFILNGEAEIDVPLRNPFLKIKRVWLDPKGKAFREAVDAILEADVVVVGPGDLYSSLIPNFLIKGIPEALKKTQAKKFFIVNAMEKLGETIGMGVGDFLSEVERYSGKEVFDYVIYNHRRPTPERILEFQKEEPFVFDYVKFNRKALSGILKPKIIGADLLTTSEGPIVHDPDILVKIILSMV